MNNRRQRYGTGVARKMPTQTPTMTALAGTIAIERTARTLRITGRAVGAPAQRLTSAGWEKCLRARRASDGEIPTPRAGVVLAVLDPDTDRAPVAVRRLV